jgi:hypothetical protein
LRTLDLHKTANVLNSDSRIKVSRREIKSILRRSIMRYPFERAWRRLPQVVSDSGIGWPENLGAGTRIA